MAQLVEGTEGLMVRALSPAESLCCVLEQGTVSTA